MSKLFKSDDTMAKPLQKGKYPFLLCLLIVPILNFIVFYVIVNANSLVLAFKENAGFVDGVVTYKFSFGQFRRIVAYWGQGGDWDLLPTLQNTMLYFFLNLIVVLPLSYLVSYFLFKKISGFKFYRVIFFMPSILSSIVLAAIFIEFLEPGGPIDKVLRSIFSTSIKPDGLLNSHNDATAMMVAYTIWSGFGVNVVLYQSAMRRIPESVIEAGKLDGVGMFREMFQLVTPLVWQTVMTTLTLAICAFLTASGPILLFTEGAHETKTISYIIYETTIKSELNLGAAIGIVCTIVSMPVVFGARYGLNKLFGKVEY